MHPHLRTLNALSAAGGTDAGLQRDVNEDRYHVDEARGVFIVIDGIGGQAAGGKAADVALSMMRERLERETGPVADRIREAVAIANNEIYRLSSSRPEWDGMACVLTAVVLKDGTATIGHVGDTRLYKIRGGRIEKITRDHSPIGEREDANELSEIEAMRHPRRNEVYRDVGSEPHSPGDAEFVDVQEIAFEPDAALLLCSDGLHGSVPDPLIAEILRRNAAIEAQAQELVDQALARGATDNITVILVRREESDRAK
jgi:serine/threonine protein phosphatase PrpC